MPTRRNNDTIPSLDAFFESKASEARRRAAEHIGKQKEPNVPVLPKTFKENPFSWAAAIFGMSDEDRIKYFGTSDPKTCIYTATSQYNDKGALVPGNVTFKRNPGIYGFTEIPLDSAKVGDLIQLSQDEAPYHSTIMVGRDETGMPHVGYSRGASTPTFIDKHGVEQPTMVSDTILSAFNEVDHEVTPTAYRYNGSPQKRGEWFGEYTSKYGLNPLDFFPKMNVEDTKLIEQPDALRVEKPVIKSEGGSINRESAWDKLSLAEKAEMIGVAVKNGITTLPEIRAKYNEFAEGGSKKEVVEDNTDTQYINTMEKVAEENYKKWGFNSPDEALIHALNDNTYNYRGYYEKYPQSAANADTHWPDEFKTVYHPTFSNESIYSGQKSQYNPNGRVGGHWLTDDLFVPAPWQFFSDYAKGGSIHIKPSHRGRLTELKKRTGKTEAELYRTGSAATRKMITFARNARKWKHDLGGFLFE